MPVSEWNGDQVSADIVKRGMKGMDQAGLFLVGRAKELINRPNRSGRDPSKPGEPPKKVTVRLQKSIVHETRFYGDRIVTQVGTNVEYGRHLELGSSAERGGHLAARPWLRPTLSDNAEAASRVFARAFTRG